MVEVARMGLKGCRRRPFRDWLECGPRGLKKNKKNPTSELCCFDPHPQSYNYTHLSAGDLLRAERAREGSQFGVLIANFIKEGKIVPVEITINLLRMVSNGFARLQSPWQGILALEAFQFSW